MPCATIHLLTAGRTLDRWRSMPGRSPFDARDPRLSGQFLHGALAPDMGFVPGVDRFLSELAHYVRTGDLIRALLRGARDAEGVAFAWGWATHHLTDSVVHPWVGHAVGERLRGDRSIRLNASEDVRTHVAVEVGLDIEFVTRDPSIPPPPDRPAFGRGTIGRLREALESTYGLRWAEERTLADHRRAVRRTTPWPRILRLLARGRGLGAHPGRSRVPDWIARPLVSVSGRLPRADSPAAGLFHPIRPPGWLVKDVAEFAETFADRFQRIVDEGPSGLENRNLENGLREEEPMDHPAAAATTHRWRRLLGRREPDAPCPSAA